LDSATRLLRYNIEEIAETARVSFLGNRFVATILAVSIIGFFALLKVDGVPAGLALWAVFGTTNQVMAGLTLLTVTLFLYFKKRNYLYTGIPMVFMLVTTIAAMIGNLRTFANDSDWLLVGVGASVFVLAIWLIIEGILRFTRSREEAAAELEEVLS